MMNFALLKEGGSLILVPSSHPDVDALAIYEAETYQEVLEEAQALLQWDTMDQYYPGGLIDTINLKVAA
jgi:hypothetical protein